MGRPKKYQNDEQRKRGTVSGKYFRWVVPALGDQPTTRLLAGTALTRLLQSQRNRGLQYYCIAVEPHPTTGGYHLDIFLVYSHRRKFYPLFLDFLAGKHGDLTRYRSMNAGILAYGLKADASPLSNLPPELSVVLDRKAIQTEPYPFLEARMCEGPFQFDVGQYLVRNGLFRSLSRTAWSKAVSLLKRHQQALCNQLLMNKQGYRPITRGLIQSRLTPDELTIFDSWSGYAGIVQHLNQVPRWGNRRPMKTPNLLLTGRSGCGKTSLIMNRNHIPQHTPLEDFTAVYKMGVKGWFPQYRSGTYSIILWNEARLTDYSYNVILELLEGAPMSLPTKGGFRKKMDNPLIIMTSNMSLQGMIRTKFGYNREYMVMARQNLAVRVHNIIVPPHLDLFLIQRLLVRAGDPC